MPAQLMMITKTPKRGVYRMVIRHYGCAMGSTPVLVDQVGRKSLLEIVAEKHAAKYGVPLVALVGRTVAAGVRDAYPY